MNQDDIGSNRALSRGFLTEAPFLVGERHKVQGARHKVNIRSQEFSFELRKWNPSRKMGVQRTIANLGVFSMLHAPCPILQSLSLKP